MSATAWIGIALAGGLGAVARFLVDDTLLVNLTGAFALGVLVGAGIGGDALRVAAIGFLGAYTTFSGWMLGDRSRPLRVIAVLAAGLLAIWLGRTLS